MINKHMMKKLGQLAEITEQAAMTRLSLLTLRCARLETEITEIMRTITKPADKQSFGAGEVYEKWVVWSQRRTTELTQQIQELRPSIIEAQGEARTALGRTSVIDKLRRRQKESTEMRAATRDEQAEQ